MKLLSFLKTATVGLALATTLSLQAVTVYSLPEDSSVTPGGPEDYSALFTPGNLVDALVDQAFSAGSVTGTLSTYIYDNVSTQGGYTFVYELKNTTVGGSHGISWLDIGGWASSILTDLGYSDVLLVNNGGAIVNPGETIRFPETGVDPASLNGKIRFTFPPGSEEPPIFAGEQGMQLVLFTSATSYVQTTGDVIVHAFDPNDIYIRYDNTEETLTVNTFTASTGAAPGVPDGGTTAILLGAAFVSLAVFARAQAWRSAA
jgi:hypothetical protein